MQVALFRDDEHLVWLAGGSWSELVAGATYGEEKAPFTDRCQQRTTARCFVRHSKSSGDETVNRDINAVRANSPPRLRPPSSRFFCTVAIVASSGRVLFGTHCRSLGRRHHYYTAFGLKNLESGWRLTPAWLFSTVIVPPYIVLHRAPAMPAQPAQHERVETSDFQKIAFLQYLSWS